MHLSDGGGGHRFGVEGHEQFFDRFAECGFNCLFGLFGGKRRQAVLQFGQCLRHFIADQIGAGGERLAEFDERRAALLQGGGQSYAGRLA